MVCVCVCMGSRASASWDGPGWRSNAVLLHHSDHCTQPNIFIPTTSSSRVSCAVFPIKVTEHSDICDFGPTQHARIDAVSRVLGAVAIITTADVVVCQQVSFSGLFFITRVSF